MLRIFVVAAAMALGLYAYWDVTTVRPLEPTITAKWSPVLRPGEVPDPQYNGGVPPWNENEKIFQNARNHVRKQALEGLERPWGSFCETEGRKKLDQAVTFYFDQRGNQEESYPKRWGDVGRQYIANEWSTSDDQRIQRLVREHYERGYLNLADLKPYIAKRIAPLLKDSRVSGAPCANARG
jgi:hypothetical protein